MFSFKIFVTMVGLAIITLAGFLFVREYHVNDARAALFEQQQQTARAQREIVLRELENREQVCNQVRVDLTAWNELRPSVGMRPREVLEPLRDGCEALGL